MTDRRDRAVLCRAEADALNRRRAMGRVVEHQRTGQRHFHRASRRARAERREQRVRANEQLAAEAAANVGRDQPHVLLWQPERLRQIRHAPVDHLVRCPDRDSVAIPGGNRGVRLHHRVRLVGRGVGRIELDGRGGEGAREIAHRRIRRSADDARRRRGRVLRRSQVERAVGAHVLDANALRRGAGLFEGLGDDQADRLVIVLDFRPAQKLRRVAIGPGRDRRPFSP